MNLAFSRGEIDADKVANALTKEQLIEWWAFGVLSGWFPEEDRPASRMLTPEQALMKVQEF